MSIPSHGQRQAEDETWKEHNGKAIHDSRQNTFLHQSKYSQDSQAQLLTRLPLQLFQILIHSTFQHDCRLYNRSEMKALSLIYL